jgi:diacylglycerol kinase family enzyme
VRLTLLHNPSSGEADHDRDELESLLARAGELTYRSLDDDAWRHALDDGSDLVVVAGGDGSIRKVFTALGSRRILAGLLPLGSANNIARTLGLDYDAAAGLLAGGVEGDRRRFDVWDVTSTWGSSRSIEAVGGGLFAQLLDEADDAPSEPSGPQNVDFGLRLLDETLATVEPHRWVIELDGARRDEEVIGVEALNTREIGPHLPFAPAADPGDGLLDVVLIRPDDRATLADYVAARLGGREDATPPELETLRAEHVVLEPPGAVRLHVDDLVPAWDLSTISWVEITRAGTTLDVLVP